jgi:hypothetical protein
VSNSRNSGGIGYVSDESGVGGNKCYVYKNNKNDRDSERE